MNYAALDACVRELRNEMVDFTSELVAIASENPPGSAYPECVRAIASRLRALDLPCEVVTYRPRKGVRDGSGAAVVLSSVGTGKRTLYFSGHYDVVPVTTPGQCTPVAPRPHALRARGGGHEGRPGLHAVRGRCPAATARAIGRTCRPRVRARRGNGRPTRLGVPGGHQAAGHEWHRDAHAGAHERRRLEREPGCAHRARDRARTRGACRAASSGTKRVRGRHTCRGRSPAAGATGRTATDALPGDAGCGTALADADRRPSRCGLELQRRAWPLRVHGRSADESRRGLSKRSAGRCSRCSTRRDVPA